MAGIIHAESHRHEFGSYAFYQAELGGVYKVAWYPRGLEYEAAIFHLGFSGPILVECPTMSDVEALMSSIEEDREISV